jgi:hypothetical protein
MHAFRSAAHPIQHESLRSFLGARVAGTETIRNAPDRFFPHQFASLHDFALRFKENSSKNRENP